ncbi:LysR family transcriptional regulator [Pectobacterium punjabense]|uniref:LysR family transcriptional regulator n=2 Tax=Pectobacterium punjabense TaxID=2108399 RepID=UPI0024066DE9|nr:LysR family transcriptional regulator [Pectobacterium punjabense]MDG0798889.1 LysR family transcriptional regulator [Pectobacterium punjabense]
MLRGIKLPAIVRFSSHAEDSRSTMINPAHFDLQSLRIFLQVAQTGSLTKAAEKFHITLSALSKRIAELERTVDCALFIRMPRGLTLTPAGKELVTLAGNVLSNVERMASEMNDYAAGVRGHVHMWANTSAIIQFLPQDLASFLLTRPLIRINLEEKLSKTVVTALAMGDADIGIFADNVGSQGVEKIPYRQDKLVVLVPPLHPLSSHQEVSFNDTLGYDYVGLNNGSSLLKQLKDASDILGRVLRLRVQVSSFDGICRMIEAGLGISVLPEGAIRPEVLGTGLRAITLTDEWASRQLWLGVKSGAILQPEVANLLAHLRQYGA